MRRLIMIAKGIYTVSKVLRGKRGYRGGYVRGGTKGYIARRILRKLLR